MSFVWDSPISAKVVTAICPTPTIDPTPKVAEKEKSSYHQNVPAVPAGSVETDKSDRIEFCGDRIRKPVKIGSIMFRLLKKYGITDAEIAEGIAKYASNAW